MDKICIISFGNSTKYRLRLDHCDQVADIKATVRDYLDKKFPTLSGRNFYDKMTVIPVDSDEEEKYRDYKDFDDNSVHEIEKVLSRSTENYESVRELNSNEPWGSATAKM